MDLWVGDLVDLSHDLVEHALVEHLAGPSLSCFFVGGGGVSGLLLPATMAHPLSGFWALWNRVDRQAQIKRWEAPSSTANIHYDNRKRRKVHEAGRGVPCVIRTGFQRFKAQHPARNTTIYNRTVADELFRLAALLSSTSRSKLCDKGRRSLRQQRHAIPVAPSTQYHHLVKGERSLL